MASDSPVARVAIATQGPLASAKPRDDPLLVSPHDPGGAADLRLDLLRVGRSELAFEGKVAVEESPQERCPVDLLRLGEAEDAVEGKEVVVAAGDAENLPVEPGRGEAIDLRGKEARQDQRVRAIDAEDDGELPTGGDGGIVELVPVELEPNDRPLYEVGIEEGGRPVGPGSAAYRLATNRRSSSSISRMPRISCFSSSGRPIRKPSTGIG